jgi:DNA-binding response OmpR family regulator
MTILLVDTTDADAAILASALRVEGFDVVVAKTADDARRVLSLHSNGGAPPGPQPIGLTIVDLMLRGEGATNGLELARELRTTYPGMRVLLTSAYHLSERQLERADCGVSGFIPKPYDLREVVEFVRNKLGGPPSSRRLWCAEPGSGVSTIGSIDGSPLLASLTRK